MGYKKIQFNEMWDWEENAELEGYFVGKKDDVGENHSNVYSIEKDDGEIVEFWGSTALDGQFASIRLGSRVKVVYEGMKDSIKRKGKQFKSFSVFVDKELFKDPF